MKKDKLNGIEGLDLKLDLSDYKYKGPLSGIYLTTNELAEVFGVTGKTIREWEDKEYIYKAARNKWHVPEVVRALYDHWRDTLEVEGRL